MKRQVLRYVIAILLVASTVLGALLWSSEYESDPDPKARFEMQAARLTPDRGYVWLELHVKRSGAQEHDLKKRVRLVTDDGVKHDPADTTFAGTSEEGFTEIWFKFWLEQAQLAGDLALEINEGVLNVKSSQPVPSLENGEARVFKTVDWEESWLGF